ncbi:hypothetical protein DE146DRAFT_701007 [Phaeosphaeria sp. MPI-PUGE-AT-0046c]|nr:hypothetical protein DE146DRAFT_701007 [Phaeosphaeria sp. MPI-PUGE-AT-0046c]
MPSMMKFVLPVLAAAGAAQAECSVSATTTIQNQGDVAAMTTCSTFSGSIAIATGTTDDIAIGGIKHLAGNLVAPANSNIKRIGASDLVNITGEMNFDGLTSLRGVDFPVLKNVSSIKWNALPVLQNIGFTASVEAAKKISIENTGVRTLEGINIVMADTIKVANNPYINKIQMQLGNVSNALDFSDNNKDVEIELTNLIWATNLTFRSVGSISLPSLTKLNGSLGIYTSGFESFAAPNLTEVAKALAIVGNDKMSNLSLPLLAKVSENLQVANNSALEEVQLPKLESIRGAFDISGNMSKVETPNLKSVSGAFNLQTSSEFDCKFFQNLKNKKLIEGKYYCNGSLSNPDVAGGSTPKGQTGNKSAASTISTANAALGLAAMAAIFLL